jgi:hypothetical protein
VEGLINEGSHVEEDGTEPGPGRSAHPLLVSVQPPISSALMEPKCLSMPRHSPETLIKPSKVNHITKGEIYAEIGKNIQGIGS